MSGAGEARMRGEMRKMARAENFIVNERYG
jgi:hypothetical protein